MAEIRQAASVILLRERAEGGIEVFLVQRRRTSSFMSNSYVFPGGVADEGETDPRVTAARELYEEAGVLLADVPAGSDWRDRVNRGGESLSALVTAAGGTLALDRLHYYAHWITPSTEKRRYSAQFFVALLPPGQTASADNIETVDEVWVTPIEALARAAELRLPPPQVHTFGLLGQSAMGGIEAVRRDAAERQAAAHAILPKMLVLDAGFALALPWDPDYDRATGEGLAIPASHPLATGPSRFVFEGSAWNNVFAPGSQATD